LTSRHFHPGERPYRTSDRARYRDDGSQEYLGQLDLQVKVRGYGLELGRGKPGLRTHPTIRIRIMQTEGSNCQSPWSFSS